MTQNRVQETSRDFESPDERREFKAHGHLDLLKFRSGNSIGRAIFEPGWRWSNDVKPIAGTVSCESPHLGYCISGEMVVRMDDGKEFRIHEGEAFEITSGHDAWVEGDKPCVLIDFEGFKNYALPKAVA